MGCTSETDSVALDTAAGVLTADVKISATAGNRASINSDGVFVAADLIETGDYVWSGRTTKAGFLLGDGSAVSRSTYAALFAVYGTTYGSGDGATTFNLPDVPGRGLVGKGTHASVNALGLTEGIVTVANRSPKHNSTVNDLIGKSIVLATGAGSPTDAAPGATPGHFGSVASPGVSVGPGGTLPIDTPAFLVANCFIKT